MDSRNELVEKIFLQGEKLFESRLKSNPSEFYGDDELRELRFGIKTDVFYCIIQRYEHPRYENGSRTTWNCYQLRFRSFYNIDPGFNGTELVIHNAEEQVITDNDHRKASFYIDDGDYGQGKVLDDEKLDECLSKIYTSLSKLLAS